MTTLTQAQRSAAYGKTFKVHGVLNGCSCIRLGCLYPSGNYGVKRATDPDYFGWVAIPPSQAEPLFAEIARQYDKRGRRIYGDDGKMYLRDTSHA